MANRGLNGYTAKVGLRPPKPRSPSLGLMEVLPPLDYRKRRHVDTWRFDRSATPNPLDWVPDSHGLRNMWFCADCQDFQPIGHQTCGKCGWWPPA